MEFEAISTSSFTDRYSNFIKDTTRVKRGYIESNTVFHPKKKGVLKLNAGLLLRYNFVNFRKGHIGLGFINNQLNTAEGAITKGVTKIITGIPYINLEYKNLASIYGGVQLFLSDVETHSQSNLKGASKRLPYGGIVFSLMNIARRKMTINRLDLGVHYSLRNSNMSDYYRLEKQETPEQFFPAGPYTANSPDDFNKDKVFNLQFITGFYEDRFMIGAEWFKATEAKFFRLPLPPSPFPTYISVLSDVKTKGFSIFGKASLLRGNKHSWNIRFNMVKQDNTSSVDYFEPVIYYPVTAGLQNSVTIGDFFMQLNAVMGLNKTVPVYFVEPKKRADDFSINYALFGYRFSFNKTWMSNMQLFVQAKNIITSKNKDSYISWPKYIGAGLNLSF